MNRSSLLGLIGSIVLAGAIVPANARADAFPALPAGAAMVDDSSLAAIRGKFVPAAQAKISAAAALAQTGGDRIVSPVEYRAASGAASPLANISSGGGPVVYFGVQMTSTWTVTNNGVTQGVQVGATVNVDLQNGTLGIGTWSHAENGGLPAAAPTGNGVTGAPPASNISSGVGQSIQVAGNGNIITNQATVDYGQAGPPAPGVPAQNDCGSACSVHVGANGVGVSIDTPQGAVSQSFGANGILQSAQVWSDLNHITNSLGVTVQTAPGHMPTLPSAVNAPQIAQILPSITGIP